MLFYFWGTRTGKCARYLHIILLLSSDSNQNLEKTMFSYTYSVKVYEFFSCAENMYKSIGKKISKYSLKFIYHVKKSAMDSTKAALEKATKKQQKTLVI